MVKENSDIKSPDEILRNYKKSMRDRLQLAVFEIPQDFFTVTLAKPKNAVYITQDEAGKGAYFVYGRFKSKELQKEEGLSQNRRDGTDENNFAERTRLATFSLQPDSDDEDEPGERYDRFAFCAWQSKPEAFENAAPKFERLGARRLSDEELMNELDNFGLELITELSRISVKRKIKLPGRQSGIFKHLREKISRGRIFQITGLPKRTEN